MDSGNKRRRVAVDVENPPARTTIKLHLSLPSGRSASVKLPLNGTVGDLKAAAQQSLGQRFLRLAGPDGTLLNPLDSLQHARLQDGDDIFAIVQQPKLAATKSAFALWCVGSDRIVTWGAPKGGGDSAQVRDQLKKVQQICATYYAFAAILANGSLVTWGNPRAGGDSSRVRDQLRSVQQIHATRHAFAVILADGSVVTWGHPDWGGDSSRVRDQLRNVRKIHATSYAFAAILADGTVVTWGGSGDDDRFLKAADGRRLIWDNHQELGSTS